MQNIHAHCIGISDTALTALELIFDVTDLVCAGLYCRRQARQTFLYLQSAQAKLVLLAELKTTVKELQRQMGTARHS